MIHVFKTNIRSENEISAIHSVLDQHPFIAEWSVDLEDIDNVLRIVSPVLSVEEITELIQNKGFECQELEDEIYESIQKVLG